MRSRIVPPTKKSTQLVFRTPSRLRIRRIAANATTSTKSTQLDFRTPSLLRIRDIPAHATTSTKFTQLAFRETSLLQIRNIPAPAPHIGHIRIISLNSPKNRNALSKQLLEELRQEIYALPGGFAALNEKIILPKGKRPSEKLEREVVKTVNLKLNNTDEDQRLLIGPTRCLILASHLDSIFCAGADLKERRKMGKEDTKRFLADLRRTFRALSSLSIPSIAAVSSIALGGGLELALACTLRVFSAAASVGLPETRLAIIPGAGGTYRLRQLIGLAPAMRMILTGQPVTGLHARAMGMCEYLTAEVDPEVTKTFVAQKNRKLVLQKAIGLAQLICQAAPGVVGPAMRAVREGTEEAENEAYNSILDSEDRLEALAAFAEKRPAVFKGK